MTFDWLTFLQRHGVEYVERGPNVARGFVNIACPFCRDDPSHHLGVPVATTKRYWGCYRNAEHRGISPVRLIRALANCSWPEAFKIANEGAEAVVEELDVLAAKLANDQREVVEPVKSVVWLPELKPISGRFVDYLIKRGFEREDAHDVGARYDLRGAVTGPFAWRLCLPLYLRGALVGWTGRAVAPAEIRYKSFPAGTDTLGRTLFNHDEADLAKRRRVLVLCEGPLDVLPLDFYGSALGVRAVGLLGLTMTEEKAGLLGELAERYERTVLLLDSDAQARAIELSARLAWLPGGAPRVVGLPEGVKDPGELNGVQRGRVFRDVLTY